MPTIVAGLRAAAERGAGDLVFHLAEAPTRLTSRDLLQQAERAAATLLARGVQPADRIGLLGPTRPEWAVWAAATWLSGATLVPLQIPLRLNDPDAFAERVAATAKAAGCRVVVADPLFASVVPVELYQSWDDIGMSAATALPVVDADDAAIVQYTSGSTSEPKGAIISHRAVRALLTPLAEHTADVPQRTLGWAPLFHDLGLVLFLLYPLLHLDEGHLLPTELFARDPSSWLRLVPETAATHTAGPESAWRAALAASERKGLTLDLSTLRVATFAAEGVDPEFVDRFLELAPRIGLDPAAMGGSYGLAEATLAVTSTPYQGGLKVLAVDREVLADEGRAVEPQGAARRLVSAGVPWGGTTAVRIVRADGSTCAEDVVGEIQVLCPAAMDGYLDAGVQPFVSGWLLTGDLGFLHDDELYITGRSRDLMIVMGQNYYPEDFEWAAARVPGVRPGRCAAIADRAQERVALLVEATDDAGPDLADRVKGAVADAIGAAPSEVIVVPRGAIAKTTSGKLRRAAMREAYDRGAFSTT